MRRVLPSLLVAAAACGHAAPSVAWPEPGGTATTGEIRGRITDRHRAALVDIPVYVVSDAGSATGVTDADGRYRITGLTPSRYVLTYRVGEALTERRDIVVEAGHAVNVTLRFDDRSFSLE